MKPLAFTTYFQNNRRRSLTMTLALSLSVFMILIIQTVTYSVLEGGRLGDAAVVEQLSKIYPSDSKEIPKEVMDNIRNDPSVERVIAMNSADLAYHHFFGSSNTQVFFVPDQDITYVLDKLGLKLTEGRMPKAGTKEILMESKFAKNKNKKIGDFIGKAVDSTEKIPGKYEVVGILEGYSMIGLVSVEEDQISQLTYALVIPRSGKLEQMNQYISNIPRNYLSSWTLDKAQDNYNNNANFLNSIFGILSIAIIFVMSFASGNASYALYFSRRYEFGLLYSIGFTRGQILLRVAKEIFLLNLLGFICGIVLGIGTELILNACYFEAHGYAFLLIQPNGLIKAITIPFCTAIFGLIPAGWILSKIDPMTVVEKYE